MPKFFAAPALLEEDLVLPIPGADGQVRDYTIKAGSAAELLTLQALDHQTRNGGPNRYVLPEADQKLIDRIGSYEDYWGIALGVDVIRAMLDDGVGADYLRLASQTASTWRLSNYDEDAALAVWSGKARTTPQPEPEETTDGSTPSAKTGDEAPSTPTEGGSTTPTPPDTNSDPEPPTTPSDTDGATSGTAST